MRILLTFILFIFLIDSTQSFASENTKNEYIVLLHGIARTSRSMSDIEEYFTDKGYNVININYKSRKYDLETLAKNIQKDKLDNIFDKGNKIHFVTHSMGGLIIRAILNKNQPKNMGRVVMLGTPNQGSEVANFLKNNILFKKFYGPAGQQLITNQLCFKRIFGTVNYELGIIAGDRSIDPISSAILKGNDDGKVLIEKTKLKGMKDHVVLHTTHLTMITSKKVMRQANNFILYGNFIHGNTN